jgi:hypothetical protein
MARLHTAFDEPETFTVMKLTNGWAVEHHGAYAHLAVSHEAARAWACKEARACLDVGRPSRVTVNGEGGFFKLRRLDLANTEVD